jgi:hypothetical protein
MKKIEEEEFITKLARTNTCWGAKWNTNGCNLRKLGENKEIVV